MTEELLAIESLSFSTDYALEDVHTHSSDEVSAYVDHSRISLVLLLQVGLHYHCSRGTRTLIPRLR
jgi:hypothetical protein